MIWNQFHRSVLFLLLFTCVAYLQGDNLPMNDSGRMNCGSLEDSIRHFSLGVAFLYLRPNIDDTHYVLSSFDNTFNGSLFPNGKRHQNKSDYTPGFSVEGIYTVFPNTAALTAKFTFLRSHARNSVSGGFLYDTNGFPGFGAQDSPVYSGVATSKNSYNYYGGELTYRRELSLFCLERFIAKIGLHGAYIGFKEHTTSAGTFQSNAVQQSLQNDLNRRSEFYGIGPQIGFQYDYILPNLWTVYAKGNGALLCGSTKSNLKYVTLRTGAGGVGIENDRVWRVIPATYAELGLSYETRCDCWNIVGELGYTFQWYGHCVNKVTGLETAFPGDSIDMFNTFSLYGPSLKLSVDF